MSNRNCLRLIACSYVASLPIIWASMRDLKRRKTPANQHYLTKLISYFHAPNR